jgi:hypothetical protein
MAWANSLKIRFLRIRPTLPGGPFLPIMKSEKMGKLEKAFHFRNFVVASFVLLFIIRLLKSFFIFDYSTEKPRLRDGPIAQTASRGSLEFCADKPR